ncbi:MAG: hypothetical protein ACJASR_000334 [Psychroserpens sp.]|jgi:hypothetical protein
MNKVRLEFDKNKKEFKSPGIIISENGIYSNDKELFKNDFNRENTLKEYKDVITKLQLNFEGIIDIDAFHTTISRCVFIPIGNWVSIVDLALENNIINNEDLIILPVSTRSPHICVLEAEGESQGSFLYNSHYFLPYFVEEYLKIKGFKNFAVEKRKEATYKFKKTIRGLVFIHLKFLQQLVYKFHNIFFVSRKQLLNKNIIATRGIIQTHFSKNILALFEENDYSIVVNESSIFPFRNYRYIKSLDIPFHYIEGEIPLKVTISEYFKTTFNFIKYSFFNKKHFISFLGLEMDFSLIMSEVLIVKYYSETQGLSLKNVLKSSKERRNIFCFDMLTPQPYYVKKHNKKNFITQLQTTLMAGIKQENFVFTDKFFFTDKGSYDSHCAINHEYKDKFAVLPDLKYASLLTKDRNLEIKTAIFFTQPAFIQEEFELIRFLKNYFEAKSITFYIKLHPRSVKRDYHQFDLRFIDSNEDSLTAISNSDLVLTRNSTIGLDSWKINVPVVFFLNNSLSNIGVTYIPDSYKGTFKNFPTFATLDDYLENINTYFYLYNNLKLDKDVFDSLKVKISNLSQADDY